MQWPLNVCPSVCIENSEHTALKPIFPGCFGFSRYFRYLERRVMHLITIKFWSQYYIFHLQWTLNPAHSLAHTLTCFNTEELYRNNRNTCTYSPQILRLFSLNLEKKDAIFIDMAHVESHVRLFQFQMHLWSLLSMVLIIQRY